MRGPPCVYHALPLVYRAPLPNSPSVWTGLPVLPFTCVPAPWPLAAPLGHHREAWEQRDRAAGCYLGVPPPHTARLGAANNWQPFPTLPACPAGAGACPKTELPCVTALYAHSRRPWAQGGVAPRVRAAWPPVSRPLAAVLLAARGKPGPHTPAPDLLPVAPAR